MFFRCYSSLMFWIRGTSVLFSGWCLSLSFELFFPQLFSHLLSRVGALSRAHSPHPETPFHGCTRLCFIFLKITKYNEMPCFAWYTFVPLKHVFLDKHLFAPCIWENVRLLALCLIVSAARWDVLGRELLPSVFHCSQHLTPGDFGYPRSLWLSLFGPWASFCSSWGRLAVSGGLQPCEGIFLFVKLGPHAFPLWSFLFCSLCVLFLHWWIPCLCSPSGSWYPDIGYQVDALVFLCVADVSKLFA